MSRSDQAHDWIPDAQTLADDRRRLEEALAVPHSPMVEATLRDELRWLRRRQRRYLRQPVAFEARLDVDEGTHRVRVCDISEGGALLELDHPLQPGAKAQLRFPDLPGRPSAWCLVRHASRQKGRVGVQFDGDPAASRALAAELVRLFGTQAPGTG
jgi:c-di-GMP-binding flagellar brake protein YcgR